jgi:hypothetical protein
MMAGGGWLQILALLAGLGIASAGYGDTKIWDVWSTSPDKYPQGSQQQRYQLEGKLRFAARKGDIQGWLGVLARGRFMVPPLDLNARDKDNRTALHFAAMSGWGGDLEQVNSSRIRNPQYANASFPWTENEYKWTFIYMAYKASLEYPDFKPADAPEGVPYQYDIPWCNIEGNVCPQPLDMDVRDKVGASPLHEAVIKDNILTLRMMVDMHETGIAPAGGLVPTGAHPQDDEFVRNIAMREEWQVRLLDLQSFFSFPRPTLIPFCECLCPYPSRSNSIRCGRAAGDFRIKKSAYAMPPKQALDPDHPKPQTRLGGPCSTGSH